MIADGRLEAVVSLGPAYDGSVRDRLAPFMTLDRLDDGQHASLLQGGEAADRGGEICACFGVSHAAVEAAIAGGATSFAEIGARMHAGTSCGSCRPEIRALLRAARPRKVA